MTEIFFKGLNFPLRKTKERSVLEVLQEALQDKSPNDGNLNDTAVRFKLIIDASPDESALRLFFQQGLLDRKTTRLIYRSDFPDTVTDDYRSVEVSTFKLAMEQGYTLAQNNTVCWLDEA